MPKLKEDSRYSHFNKDGTIDLMYPFEFKELFQRVVHRAQKEAECFFILLYLTGARPSEIAELVGSDVQKDKSSIVIKLLTKKGGRARLIYLPSNDFTKKVLEHSKNRFPEAWLFPSFRTTCKNVVKWKRKDGTECQKEYERSGWKFRYWSEKWFKITPYFFRHNRFSFMAQNGATWNEIASTKGSKSIGSVMPYMHLGTRQAKKLSKYFRL